jgi:anti-anti-sigma factor
LQRLYFVDAAGLAVLREARALLAKRGGGLSLAGVRPRVQHILKRAGLDGIFSVYRTIEEAVSLEGCS